VGKSNGDIEIAQILEFAMAEIVGDTVAQTVEDNDRDAQFLSR
jgi:hypothetical protein